MAGEVNSALSSAFNQPYSNMPVQPVAGFTPDQASAFTNVRNLQGTSNPYFAAATNYANRSAAPISDNEVQNYFNPYFNEQLAALNDTLGAKETQARGADVATAGGIGGDRPAVASAERERQYNLARGQLAGNTWQAALGAAQQDRQRQQATSALLASYGPAAVGAGLSEAGALYNTGSQQQQLQQAQLNAPYQWGVGQFNYPAFLAQLGSGVTGTLAGALGGTKTGTETYPPTSILPSILGAGTAGIGAAGKLGWQPFSGKGSGGTSGEGVPTSWTGGRISYAAGGGESNDPRFADSFWDHLDDTRKKQQEASKSGGIGGISNDLIGQGIGFGLKNMPWGSIGSGLSDLGGSIAGGLGGLGESLGAALPALALVATGGAVHASPYPLVQGYQEGGDIEEPAGGGVLGGNLSDMDIRYFDPRLGKVVDIPRGEQLPDVIRGPESPGLPPSATPYARVPISDPEDEGPAAIPRTAQPVAGGIPGAGLPSLPNVPPLPNPGLATQPKWADFLLNMGAGMMAHAGERDARGLPIGGGWLGQTARAAGLGTQAGVKAMDEARKENLNEWKNYIQGQHLLHQAQMEHLPYTTLTAAQRETNVLATRKQQLEEMKPVQIGWDALMRPVFAKRDPKTGEYVDPRSGKPIGTPSETKPSGDSGPVKVGNQEIIPGQNVPEGVNLDVLREHPELAGTIVGLSQGKANITSVPQRNRSGALELVKQFDPSWDQLTYGRRQKAYADLASNGNAGKLMMATNQLLPHLNTAMEKAIDLHNGNVLAGNAIQNWWDTNIKGDPRVKSFETVREVAALDAARLLRGSGAMAEKDIEFWRQNLSSSGSPRQLAENIRLLASDLMEARYSSIKHQFKVEAGHEYPGDLRSEEALGALGKIKKSWEGVQVYEKLSPKDRNAVDWARSNPKNPKARQILESNGLE